MQKRHFIKPNFCHKNVFNMVLDCVHCILMSPYWATYDSCTLMQVAIVHSIPKLYQNMPQGLFLDFHYYEECHSKRQKKLTCFKTRIVCLFLSVIIHLIDCWIWVKMFRIQIPKAFSTGFDHILAQNLGKD
jgi:hypothetical protein